MSLGPISSFTCPRCNRKTYHPEDIRFRYCASCRQYVDESVNERHKQRWFRMDYEGELWELIAPNRWVIVMGLDPTERNLSWAKSTKAMIEHFKATKLVWWSRQQTCPAHGERGCDLCSKNSGHRWCDQCNYYNLTGLHWDTCPRRIRF